MPKGPAARVGDPVAHPLPPVLTGGSGSPNVLIGGKPAWRGLPKGPVGGLQAAKQANDTTIKSAEASTAAAAGTPGYGAAKAAEQATKIASQAAMTAMITSLAAGGGADMHNCQSMPPPVPPPLHGAGVVIDGSATVLINGSPACRVGDTILEAFGPGGKIAMGAPTVIIGG